MSGNFWLEECKKEEHPCDDAVTLQQLANDPNFTMPPPYSDEEVILTSGHGTPISGVSTDFTVMNTPSPSGVTMPLPDGVTFTESPITIDGISGDFGNATFTANSDVTAYTTVNGCSAVIKDGIINPDDVVEGTFENCTTTNSNTNTWAWDVACSEAEDEVDSNVELADVNEVTDEEIKQEIQLEVVLLSEEMAELREKNFCGYAAKVRKSLNQTLREYSNEGVLRDPLIVFAHHDESMCLCLRVKYKIGTKDTSFVIGI